MDTSYLLVTGVSFVPGLHSSCFAHPKSVQLRISVSNLLDMATIGIFIKAQNRTFDLFRPVYDCLHRAELDVV